jgi:hypothetical protein
VASGQWLVASGKSARTDLLATCHFSLLFGGPM